MDGRPCHKTTPDREDIDWDIEELIQLEPDSGGLREFTNMINHQSEQVGNPVGEKIASVINKLLRVKLKDDTLKDNKNLIHSQPIANQFPNAVSIWKFEDQIYGSGFKTTEGPTTLPYKQPYRSRRHRTSFCHWPRQMYPAFQNSSWMQLDANVKLNAKQRELIHLELSQAYKPLYSGEADLTLSALLFGDNLPSPKNVRSFETHTD